MQEFKVIEFDCLDSSNRFACEHLAELNHGDVVHALRQTAGRGRWSRHWISAPSGDLTCSVVLKPTLNSPPTAAECAIISSISHLMAVSICRLLGQFGIQGQIKWPNDVLVEARKVSGILAESVTRGPQLLGVVLGVGLNLSLDEDRLREIDQPATSARILLGNTLDARACRDELMRIFFSMLPEFLESGFVSIRSEYLARSVFLGKQVSFRTARCETRLAGTAQEVNEAGELILRTDDDQTVAVSAGELLLPKD